MAVIWGIPYFFIKIAVGELSPASLVFLRTAIGAALLLPLAARTELWPILRQWKWILVYTAVEVAAPWFLLSDAEQRISSSLTGLLLAATPSFGAILAWATGGADRLDRRRVVGLAVGFVGVGALVGLEREQGSGLRLQRLAACVDPDRSVDHEHERVLLDLVLAELLPRVEPDQNRASRFVGVEHDRRAASSGRFYLVEVPAPHGGDPNGTGTHRPRPRAPQRHALGTFA